VARKLWEKGDRVDDLVQRFCTGDDWRWDQRLLAADIEGSRAHARMLARIGILTRRELARVLKALDGAGEIRVTAEDEDVHTALENYLVAKLGELGKKIHTGRSRNDQVLLATRLWLRREAREIAVEALALADEVASWADRHRDAAWPGYTHTRRAMPSSAGHWAGAFAEALLDDAVLLRGAYDLLDQSPLGSAAGYGVALPLDRAFVARELGFARVQANTLYVQNSRGKFEAHLLAAIEQVMLTLNRMASDIVLLSSEEVGFVTLPKEYCTGSSIMPNKRNPDPLELVRGSLHRVRACREAIIGTVANLTSGYHRDLQLTKGPVMEAVDVARACLGVMRRIAPRIGVDLDRARRALTPDVFATDEAVRLVKRGMPFRDAYREVASRIGSLAGEDPVANLRAKRHVGAPGNLGIARLRRAIARERSCWK